MEQISHIMVVLEDEMGEPLWQAEVPAPITFTVGEIIEVVPSIAPDAVDRWNTDDAFDGHGAYEVQRVRHRFDTRYGLHQVTFVYWITVTARRRSS